MQTRPTNQMAIISVIAGAVSWFALPVAGAIVAIVCGHIGRKQIRQTGEEGDGLALAGLVLGYLHMAATCVIAIIAGLFFGGVLGAAALGGPRP